MKPHDRVVKATDLIAEILPILARINYANEQQTARNLGDAIARLREAVEVLEPAIARPEAN